MISYKLKKEQYASGSVSPEYKVELNFANRVYPLMSKSEVGYSNTHIFISPVQWKGIDVPKSIFQTQDVSSKSLKKNDYVDTLLNFITLEKNWNGYGADPIPKKVFDLSFDFIKDIDIPDLEIFPTAQDSIQFEAENKKGYLELEIFEDKFTLYLSTSEGEDTIENFSDLIEAKNRFKELYASLKDRR